MGARTRRDTTEDDVKRFERVRSLPRLAKALLFPRYYLPYICYKLGLLHRRRKALLCFGDSFEHAVPRGLHGTEIAVDASDTAGYSLLFFGRLIEPGEVKLTKFLIRNLAPRDVFYDIGANFGFYTHLAVGLCREVHAFEPAPVPFAALGANLGDRTGVFLNCSAVADRSGEQQFLLPGSSSSGSLASVVKLDARERGVGKIKVTALSLDSYVAGSGKHAPTFMKIDVEGAERLVILGARQTLSQYAPVISMEVWPRAASGDVSMLAVRELRALGYDSYMLDDDGRAERTDGDLSAIVESKGLRLDNFIFKKGKK